MRISKLKPSRVFIDHGHETAATAMVDGRPTLRDIPPGTYHVGRMAPGKPAVMIPVGKTIEEERWLPSDDRNKAILEAVQAGNEQRGRGQKPGSQCDCCCCRMQRKMEAAAAKRKVTARGARKTANDVGGKTKPNGNGSSQPQPERRPERRKETAGQRRGKRKQ